MYNEDELRLGIIEIFQDAQSYLLNGIISRRLQITAENNKKRNEYKYTYEKQKRRTEKILRKRTAAWYVGQLPRITCSICGEGYASEMALRLHSEAKHR